jgi:hypothetical protein
MEGNTKLAIGSPTSPSSEEILEKLEALIEPKEESGDVEEYKITILVLTIAHGEKIILRPHISDLNEFEDYERELKGLPWYTFVEKTYIYGYAPFGNVCLISHNPNEIWSRPETKLGFQKTLNSLSIDTTNRKTFAKTVSQVNTDFITRPVSRSETSQAKPRGVIMAEMFKTDKDRHSENMPIKGIMNPMTMRLEIVPSLYVLSGKNTDRIEEYIKQDPSTFMASQDRYSGIFVSVLSDNRDNTYEFPSLFNLADGRHIMEIFQRLKNPIPGINIDTVDGSELYKVIQDYINYWNRTYGRPMLDIRFGMNGYQIRDKTTGKIKSPSYFMLTQLNTMNVYVIANLVFDFLASKEKEPNGVYRKDIEIWVEELKEKNSKIINISTACEGVNPAKISMPTIQDITPHINRNSISRSITQNETEKGGPDIINFDDLDEYISNFEEKVVEEAEGLRSWKARRRRTIKRSKRKTRTKKRSTMKKYKNNKKRKDYKK